MKFLTKLKSINIYRLVWVSCIFLVLIIILILVMNYKINYEYLDSKYLYFYYCESDNQLCVTEVQDDSLDLYSIYECGYDDCPTFTNVINNNYVLLREKEDSYILYDYMNDSIISNGYSDYRFINNNYIIVTKGDRQGVIDLENNIVVDISYEQIGWYTNGVLNGYNLEDIVAKKNGKYGIISFETGEVKEQFSYSEDRIETLLVFIEA